MPLLSRCHEGRRRAPRLSRSPWRPRAALPTASCLASALRNLAHGGFGGWAGDALSSSLEALRTARRSSQPRRRFSEVPKLVEFSLGDSLRWASWRAWLSWGWELLLPRGLGGLGSELSAGLPWNPRVGCASCAGSKAHGFENAAWSLGGHGL